MSTTPTIAPAHAQEATGKTRRRPRLLSAVPSLLTSSLLRRLLILQLLLALVPVAVVAYFALSGMRTARQSVVQQSQTTLDESSFTALRQRDVSVAEGVAAFLRERESDLRVLATLPRTSAAYAAFSSSMRSQIRTIDRDGHELTLDVPLYREVAFVDTFGREQVRADDVCDDYPFTCSVRPAADLTDVSNPANTLYRSETYFQDAAGLDAGRVYVGQPIGAYVPYEDAYAGSQNRAGQRYRGVVRFAMPVMDGSNRAGIVVMAVESIHLIEQVAHIAPSNPVPQVEIDPREADLTYMVAPDGWVIAHPRAYNIAGVDQQGKPVPSVDEADRADAGNLFRPANLLQMGFIDASLPALVQANQAGQTKDGTTLVARPPSAPERAIAAASIPYYTGRYNNAAGFGMVVMSTDWARFHVGSALLGKQLDNRVTDVTARAQQVGVIAGIAALCLAVIFALTIALPILRLTRVAREIELDRWEQVQLDGLQRTKGRDELSRLTRVFASMAREVHERIALLRRQVEELRVVIDEGKRQEDVQQIVDSDFFRDLNGKARQMRRQRQRLAADAPAASDGAPVAALAGAGAGTAGATVAGSVAGTVE